MRQTYNFRKAKRGRHQCFVANVPSCFASLISPVGGSTAIAGVPDGWRVTAIMQIVELNMRWVVARKFYISATSSWHIVLWESLAAFASSSRDPRFRQSQLNCYPPSDSSPFSPARLPQPSRQWSNQSYSLLPHLGCAAAGQKLSC